MAGTRDTEDAAPKRPGRPPGVPNKINAELREMIMTRGKPLELLCDVARGKKIRLGPQAGPETADTKYVYPNLKDRTEAARLLLDKILPSLKAQEISGADGEQLIPRAATEASEFDVSRRIAFMLERGLRESDRAQQQPDPHAGCERGGTGPGGGVAPGAPPRPRWAGVSVSLAERLPGGRERWTVTDEETGEVLRDCSSSAAAEAWAAQHHPAPHDDDQETTDDDATGSGPRPGTDQGSEAGSDAAA